MNILVNGKWLLIFRFQFMEKQCINRHFQIPTILNDGFFVIEQLKIKHTPTIGCYIYYHHDIYNYLIYRYFK